MIVMAFNNQGIPKIMTSKKRLQDEMNYILANCGYRIFLNLLPGRVKYMMVNRCILAKKWTQLLLQKWALKQREGSNFDD